MRELVADRPAGIPTDPTLLLHDPVELSFASGDLDDAYGDLVLLPFGEATGWRGAS